MTNLQTIEKAYDMMIACNQAYDISIFIDPELDTEDEAVDFDILPSNMEHAIQVCGLLNLTLQITTKNNELNYSIF